MPRGTGIEAGATECEVFCEVESISSTMRVFLAQQDSSVLVV